MISNPSEPQVSLCIFAKPPVPGEAKTRLIPAAGPRGAAAIARALLADILSIAAAVSACRLLLSVSQEFDADGMPPVEQFLQPDGNLGQRIEATLRYALSTTPAALALAADTPGLSTAMLELAITRLQTCDAVLGPTHDGGFYLLGLKSCPPGLLSDIRWGQAATLTDTIAALGLHKFRSARLQSLADLDTPEDLSRLIARFRSGALHSPALETVLASLRLAASKMGTS